MKFQYFLILLIFLSLLSKVAISEDVSPLTEVSSAKKDQVLDFSSGAGVIEGELNRPSILLELSSNFNNFDDLVLLREDFNSYHEIDSTIRFRYFEEKR